MADRLWEENPRGIKGLAYVLVQIRLAVQEGRVKPEVDVNDQHKRGLKKFAAMFNKAASTR